ncbi:MAG: hypothetical protein Harvfovirus6_20 [Harvfovirus sp.]|uniref:Uncharacterized protein n=1 Tax=Harvfovirus sp. TaxID=2487768 RepID=A0A3G5A0V7_9VIRU|nr:MAG: hypothetical protein Harvfovirus6_20 [Harvfovirus sp.]
MKNTCDNDDVEDGQRINRDCQIISICPVVDCDPTISLNASFTSTYIWNEGTNIPFTEVLPTRPPAPARLVGNGPTSAAVITQINGRDIIMNFLKIELTLMADLDVEQPTDAEFAFEALESVNPPVLLWPEVRAKFRPKLSVSTYDLSPPSFRTIKTGNFFRVRLLTADPPVALKPNLLGNIARFIMSGTLSG